MLISYLQPLFAHGLTRGFVVCPNRYLILSMPQQFVNLIHIIYITAMGFGNSHTKFGVL